MKRKKDRGSASAARRFVEALEERRLLSAVLVKDIDQSAASSDPSSMVDVNGTLFFAAKSGTSGNELWRSDGTADGTFLVKDINPGVDDSNPQHLTNVSGTLFFWVVGAQQGLWKSDGTPDGTLRILAGQLPGPNQAALGSRIFYNELFDRHLWTSDGTTAGTLQLSTAYISWLTACNGAVFFNSANQLWRTDGTLAGTKVVWDKSTTPVSDFACAGNVLYFSGTNGVSAQELWKSDGTAAGTVPVTPQAFWSPQQIVAVGNNVYFGATSPPNVHGLWKSDGTTEGTVRVAEFQALGPGVGVGNTYFYVQGGNTEIWKSDGTPMGAAMVKDINPGQASSSPTNLTAFAGQLYFLANDGSHGFQLWKSDGTESGTQMVMAVGTGTAASFGPMSASGDRLFFTPTTENGRELWSTDGTEANTAMVRDIHTGTAGSSPTLLTPFDHKLYFATRAGLWVSDGTAAGTAQISSGVPTAMAAGSSAVYAAMSVPGDGVGVELYKVLGQPPVAQLVKDIYPGASSSNPSDFVNANGITYFIASNPTNGRELWRTDGTEAGTWLVRDIASGANAPYAIIEMDGNLYFRVSTAVGGEIWKSDGTAAGTGAIKQLYGSGNPVNTTSFVVMGHDFYFGADTNTNYVELWKSNGTPAGTVRVGGISSGSLSDMGGLMAHNGRLYFRMLQKFTGLINAWTSDGVRINMLEDLVGPVDYSPGDFVPFGDKVAFLTGQVGYGAPALWFTDATAGGTYRLDVGRYVGLVTNGPLLFFTTSTTSSALPRLWKSDGTMDGTSPVRDLTGNDFVYSTKNYSLLDGTFYFSSATPAIGAELWKISSPSANSGGVYSVPAGAALQLDGRGSSDPDPAENLQYVWDLDGDGIFGETGPAASRGDETGATPNFSSIDLLPGTYTIALRVTDSIGLDSTASAQITITPPAFMNLSADAQISWSGSPGARILSVHAGTLTLNGDLFSVYPGISIIANNPAAIHLAATQHIKQLTLLDSATLDLCEASLFVALQPQQTLADIGALIKSEKIGSSAAPNDARLGIGYLFDAASNSVHVTQTLLGDLNLDRTVSISDFLDLSSHLGQTDANWSGGDLNYDEQVSVADFITLASNFGQTYSPSAPQPAASTTLATAKREKPPRLSRSHVHHRRAGRTNLLWSAHTRRWSPDPS